MGKAKKDSQATKEKLNVRNNGTRARSSARTSSINLPATKKVIKDTKFAKNNAASSAKGSSFIKKINNACSDGSNGTFQSVRKGSNSEQTGMCKEVCDNLSYKNIKSCENFIYRLKAVETGECYRNLQVWKRVLINNFSTLDPFDIMNPFQRRVTAISWNQKHPNFAAVGSKGGELSLINTNSLKRAETYINGVGPGGSINAIKFDDENPSVVYTACLTGDILCQDFESQQNTSLLTSEAFENWFCSVDILPEKKMLVSGDCKGQVYFTTTKGVKVSGPIKLHKNKVSHIEICPKDSNTMVTASIDRTVKIWDIRMISQAPLNFNKPREPLVFLPHLAPVNSAYFSSANSCSLLTTDQQKDIRVYSCGTWDLRTTIRHPHRQFQHLTPIKASWYPLEDIIVVGRFPDDKFMESDWRSIDFYDAHTGEILYRLSSPIVKGISVLNYFNPTGDILISGNGRNIVFWKSLMECI